MHTTQATRDAVNPKPILSTVRINTLSLVQAPSTGAHPTDLTHHGGKALSFGQSCIHRALLQQLILQLPETVHRRVGKDSHELSLALCTALQGQDSFLSVTSF